MYKPTFVWLLYLHLHQHQMHIRRYCHQESPHRHCFLHLSVCRHHCQHQSMTCFQRRSLLHLQSSQTLNHYRMAIHSRHPHYLSRHCLQMIESQDQWTYCCVSRILVSHSYIQGLGLYQMFEREESLCSHLLRIGLSKHFVL